MESVHRLKEQEIVETPLLLFECEFSNGRVERWSTHRVELDGQVYEPRVVRHDVFDQQGLAEQSVDTIARVTLTLANTDSKISQIERLVGWKGARLTVKFVFYSLPSRRALSPAMVLFRGVGEAPDEIREAFARVTFHNRLALHRIFLPEVRIQRLCPWRFPATAEQRREAVDGGARGRYSPWFRCGYSADIEGGVGNLDEEGQPYTSCEYTRAACVARGMFFRDQLGRVTARFGGIEFLPPAIRVRAYGDREWRLVAPIQNQALYNDFVPLVYGTVWYQPPVVFARSDGNLTHLEVLLGMGELDGVLKVIVNDVELPEGRPGVDLTGTGWYNVVSLGGRTGSFNLNFVDPGGSPQGDPYGSMAYLAVAVPNSVASGQAIPKVEVLVRGLKLEQFDKNGNLVGYSFSANPVWVLLDILRRCGWTLDEIDLSSFAETAAYCDELVPARDGFGNVIPIPRYRCNLVLRHRRSAAEVIRGIRMGSCLYLTYGLGGRLQVWPEASLAVQQPVKPEGSNSREPLNGGWPAYEFDDGTYGFGGILRRPDGEPSLRLWARPSSEMPNRYSVEFQDEFNGFQQDGLTLVDPEDVARTGYEVSAEYPALGIPNFSQATRVLRRQLLKNTRGNLFAQFETSVRGLGLKPGDIITLTYLREGLDRTPFRVLRVSAGRNYETLTVTCQLHDDAWYEDAEGAYVSRVGQVRRGVSLPRPIAGTVLLADGETEYAIGEEFAGEGLVRLAVEFAAPAKLSSSGLPAPWVSLTPEIETGNGALPGGVTYYYGVTAVTEEGVEGELSLLVRAVLPQGATGYSVRLRDMKFPPGARAFHVYRGTSPANLRRIATSLPLEEEFIDNGLPAQPLLPPDPNFDHARFYWRWELAPEHPVDGWTSTSLRSQLLHALDNEYRGARVRITRGRGAGQERIIVGNDANTIFVDRPWAVEPDQTSWFVLAEGSWRFGAMAATSPAYLEVPARVGMVVHVMGRSATAAGLECSEQLCPVTRWRIEAGPVGGTDQEVPPLPVFALVADGRGGLELSGVGFETLENTGTITSGTLTVHYWDELIEEPGYLLAQDLEPDSTVVSLEGGLVGHIGQLIQIGTELMVIEEVLPELGGYQVRRASHGTEAVHHVAGEKVYHLQRKVFVIPFARGLFGSPASGSFTYSIYLPDVRVAAAELYVTNERGNSETRQIALTHSEDLGLRTLSGGQLTVQVEGYLAVQHSAAPALIVEQGHSVRDIFAVIQEAPAGGNVELMVRQDGQPYCSLTIRAGERASSVVSGRQLGPLREKASLTLDIISVPVGPGTFPGKDLTLIIRL